MLIQIDAKQLEWRAACQLSQDQTGLAEINNGVDTHSENEKAFILPSRLIAKIYLFRTIFRGSGWSFAHDPNFMHVSDDPKFWDAVNEKFYKKYNGLDRWHKQLAELVVRKKPIIIPSGAEYLIPLREDGSIPWTVLANYPVQGFSAHLMMVARITLWRRLQSLGVQAILVSTVHDSIVLDTPAANVEQVSTIAMDSFGALNANVKRLWNYELLCPFPGEVKVGRDMHHMIDLDKYLTNGI